MNKNQPFETGPLLFAFVELTVYSYSVSESNPPIKTACSSTRAPSRDVNAYVVSFCSRMVTTLFEGSLVPQIMVTDDVSMFLSEGIPTITGGIISGTAKVLKENSSQ